MRRHARLLSTISWIIFCAVIVITAARLESLPLVERLLGNIQVNSDIKLINGIMLIILILDTIIPIMLARRGRCTKK